MLAILYVLYLSQWLSRSLLCALPPIYWQKIHSLNFNDMKFAFSPPFLPLFIPILLLVNVLFHRKKHIKLTLNSLLAWQFSLHPAALGVGNKNIFTHNISSKSSRHISSQIKVGLRWMISGHRRRRLWRARVTLLKLTPPLAFLKGLLCVWTSSSKSSFAAHCFCAEYGYQLILRVWRWSSRTQRKSFCPRASSLTLINDVI